MPRTLLLGSESGAGERRHGPPVSEPTERVSRVESHLLALAAEQLDQRLDRRRVGDLYQRRRGGRAGVAGALDRLEEGRHRRRSLTSPMTRATPRELPRHPA